MPQYNFKREHREVKKSLIPKSTTHATGELVVSLNSIDVIPMGTNGYKRIFITYNHGKETIVTEFNPPSLKSFKYALKDKEGKTSMNVNLNYDTELSLYNEDLWKNYETFYKAQVDKDGKAAMNMGKDDLYYYKDVNFNDKTLDKSRQSVQRYGILYAFEKLMSHISPYSFNADSNVNVADWSLFSNSYKHPASLLTTITDKNIKNFGYFKTIQWVTNGTDKKEKLVIPVDTVAKEVRVGKTSGKDYTVCLPVQDNPAYIETLKSKVLDFTKKFALVNDEYKEVKEDEKGYFAAFYSYFEMLSKFVETLKEKGAESLNKEFKIFVYGDVNKFETNEGKEIETPLEVVDYTNTNRRWFYPYNEKLNDLFPQLFVSLYKYGKAENGLIDYPSAKLLEKQKEYFKLVGVNDNDTSTTSKSADTNVTSSDDDDDLPF